MRDLAVTGFFFILLPVVLVRPHWGILIWTWIGLMTPQALVFGFARSIPFALIVGIVTIVAIAISPEKKKFPLNSLIVTLILFEVWVTMTTTTSLFPDLAWPYWQDVMKIQLMILLTILVMQSKERITALVWVSTLSVAFYGVKGGIFTVLRGGNVMIEGPGTGQLSGNNALAVAFAMTLPLMYWLYLQAQARWLRYSFIAGIALTVIATLGTFSRGGLLAIAGMGMWLWLKSRQKLVIALVLALLIPIGLSVMPDDWYNKMGSIRTYEQDTSAMARINSWGFAWNLARDKPLTGGGFQAFQPDAFSIWGPDATSKGLRADEWHDAHSIWFKVLAEQGFPGIILYVLIWYFAWRMAGRIVKDAKERPDLLWARDLAAMIQVSLVAYWVGGSFLSFAYWDYPLILVAMLVAMRAVLDRRTVGQEVVDSTNGAPVRQERMQL